MSTIAIDCRFASTHSGLGRYTRELTRHLLSLDDCHRYVLIIRPEAQDWTRSLPVRSDVIVREVNAPHYSLREHVLLPRLLREQGADLLFSMHFNVPLFCPTPFIATIHDLILHHYPNAAPIARQAAYRLQMRRTVNAAQKLICVSDFVRKEVSSVYGPAVAGKTLVIHEGVASAFSRQAASEQQRVRSRYGIAGSFYLYVGNAKQHKNLQLLLQCFRALGDTGTSLVLVTGGREAERLQLPSGVQILPHVADEDLPALYSSARALVTCSLYEGFCLPVVEALSCGCPVVAPQHPPFPEVTQGRALLVPCDVDSFVKALRTTSGTETGFTRPTWEDAARSTLRVIRDVLHR